MRYVFRAAGFFALFLALAPASRFPAYALEGGGAASSERAAKSVPEATAGHSAAVSRPVPETGRRSGTEQADDHARDGWVKVESGSRQAYVGIHGGTAPLSLMRSTDGVLFAFTGQTGNDFTQVLRGGNASRSAPHHPGRDGAKDQMPDMRPAEGSVSAGNTPSRSASASKIAPPSGSASPARPVGEKRHKAPRAVGVLPAASPDRGQPSANSVKLVFASGEMASEGYRPFGLTPSADMPPGAMGKGSGTASATPAAPIGKPLKLCGYRQFLNYSGNL